MDHKYYIIYIVRLYASICCLEHLQTPDSHTKPSPLLRVSTHHHHHSPLPAPAAGLCVCISVQYVVTQLCCICPLKKWLGLRSVFVLPCNLHVGTRPQTSILVHSHCCPLFCSCLFTFD